MNALASPRPARESLTAHILPTVLMVAITVFGARIFSAYSSDLIRICLWVQILVLLCALAVEIWRLHLGVMIAALSCIAYLAVEHLLFSRITGSAPNFNTILSYIPIFSFVTFSASRLSMRRTLQILSIVSFIYLLVYVAGFRELLEANSTAGFGALSADSVREARLYLLTPWAAFAAFYGLKVTDTKPWWRVALLAAGLSALWLSGSRTFQALFVLVFLLGMVGWTGRWARTAIFLAVIAIALVMLGGLVFPHWNPFEYLSGDDSGAYRAVEYRRAVNAIQQYWAFGIGLPSDSFTLSQYLKAPRYEILYASDLGPVGILLLLGVPGLLTFLGIIYFCTVGSSAAYRAPEIAALQLTCILTAAVGCISPMIVLEPSSMFLGLMIAVQVRQYRQRSAERRIERGVLTANAEAMRLAIMRGEAPVAP